MSTANSFLTDTSLEQTRGVRPCHTSVIYFISLQGGTSLRRTVGAGPEHVCLKRELIVDQTRKEKKIHVVNTQDMNV